MAHLGSHCVEMRNGTITVFQCDEEYRFVPLPSTYAYCTSGAACDPARFFSESRRHVLTATPPPPPSRSVGRRFVAERLRRRGRVLLQFR